MTGLPRHVTAATGMDALTHAIEAFVGQWSTDYTDRMALAAVGMIYEQPAHRLPERQEPRGARADGAGGDLRRPGVHAGQRRLRPRHRAPAGRQVPHAARPRQRDHAAARAEVPEPGHHQEAGRPGGARQGRQGRRAAGGSGEEVPGLGRGAEPRSRHPARIWTRCARRTFPSWPRPPAGRPTPTIRCRATCRRKPARS